jgi:hypothetical protein
VKSLGFETAVETLSDTGRARRIRRSRFERRSSLPISAACVVANGMRETLGSLLGAPVGLRLFEPVIPEPRAWSRILEKARLYRVSGNVADAAIVLREPDATALIAALFGETHQAALSARELSPIECDVLDGTVSRLAANLSAVCGTREGHCAEPVGAIAGFVTFFELSIEEPVTARIGIALSRDPLHETRGSLEIGHLADVRFTARASLDLGSIDAPSVARLTVGATLPVEPGTLRQASLTAHGRKLAGGSCGVRNGRYAFSVDAM